MNKAKLKTYAPQARRDFIKAVTDRAAYYGLTNNKVEGIIEKGDVAIIAGKAFPRAIAAKRKRLEETIKRLGFEQVIEAMAYTWFNRFVAIRFMELHGYLDHGYRVLSHPEGKATPEIVEHAEHVDLPGLDREKVIDLKLEGTKEAELYGLLLIAQCNALSKAMPFLFEAIDDETELLLPENLLHSDSLIRKLINEIPDEEWQEVEIIGWIYQFYISEKKDQVIGKVVKSEDIPAATQLFTPNWIVKYMVQNTLGRQWVATYPNSPLKHQMDYYIEPSEQTPEVQEQLKVITPGSLNPEELTLLDPAAGSGHILVESYDLLKAIYQERGYRSKDIPRLILQKNLFGLEIDDRAAQLAAFALMMKARADDRRIFERGVQPHVLAIQESKGLNAEEITDALNSPILKLELPPPEMLFEEMEDEQAPLFSRKNLSVKGEITLAYIAQIIDLFEHGKTYGALIRMPEYLADKLLGIDARVNDVLVYGEMFGKAAARLLKPLIGQARLLVRKFSVVVTNPPYMKSKYFTALLKAFTNKAYERGHPDLYGCFIERNLAFAEEAGFVGMITIPNWLFLSSFEALRRNIILEYHLFSLLHNGRGVWGADFGSCAFVLQKSLSLGRLSLFRRLFSKQGEVQSNSTLVKNFNDWVRFPTFRIQTSEFIPLPFCVFGYWLSPNVRKVFNNTSTIEDHGPVRQGFQTGNNDRFLRFWYEVSFLKCKFDALSKDEVCNGYRWVPYNKGGEFCKWYGNNEFIVAFDKPNY